MRLHFEKTQENGDATSNYNVTWNETEITVDDFCDAVLGHSVQQPEWGKIYISEPGDHWHATICEYDRSVMEFQNDYFDYKNKKVVSAWANGGWGAMSYWLTVM